MSFTGPNSAASLRSDATLCRMNTMLLHANLHRADGATRFNKYALDILSQLFSSFVVSLQSSDSLFHMTNPLSLHRILPHLNADRYSPKSRNCFMESGEGENLEKCSMCLGTLAKAAFFMMNLTNFIIASGQSQLCSSGHTPCPMLGYSD